MRVLTCVAVLPSMTSWRYGSGSEEVTMVDDRDQHRALSGAGTGWDYV